MPIERDNGESAASGPIDAKRLKDADSEMIEWIHPLSLQRLPAKWQKPPQICSFEDDQLKIPVG